jgi:hypothetical protein
VRLRHGAPELWTEGSRSDGLVALINQQAETLLEVSGRDQRGLQSTVEELETTNYELQATNEELETTDKELQSMTGQLRARGRRIAVRPATAEAVTGRDPVCCRHAAGNSFRQVCRPPEEASCTDGPLRRSTRPPNTGRASEPVRDGDG